MPHKVHLTPQEDQQLLALSRDGNVPARTRQRAEALRLSFRDWTVPRIAEFLDWHAQSVRDAFVRWWDHGIEGLFDTPRPGASRRWRPEDIDYLENKIIEQSQTYNSQQLADILAAERGVRLSAYQLRRILKKRASSGNECARVLLERTRSYSSRRHNR